ncbi:hypothetical protein [Lysinibacillus xylanilyticus]|uniref:hypothetical protein n=1 Tax=Lysinibacillus xylanilyticus TaxID=582475 RepID=UPI0036DB3516
MIMGIISAQPLVVEPEDFLHVGISTQGRDQGKYAYINTRWVKENCAELFDGESYESCLVVMSNEIQITESLHDTFASWFDATCILTLNPEEVHQFNQFYELSGDEETMSLLLEQPYQKDISVGKMILINQLDVLISMFRRGSGGNE